MSATTLTRPLAKRVQVLSWPRTKVWWAFVVSRVLAVGGGALAATTTVRVAGWQRLDPASVSTSLGAVGNVLAAASVRWDSIHYLSIAAHGYRNPADTAFFPLYPLLIHVGGLITGSDVWAGVLISLVSFAIALWLLHRLCELELGRRAADATVLLLAFAPVSFFFSAVYTESLYLALSVGAVLAARQARWKTASVLAALCAVTRVPGVLVIIPVAWWWHECRHDPGAAGNRCSPAWLLGAPVALAGFLCYLAARGFTWLAPLTAQTGTDHGHVVLGPIFTLGVAVRSAVLGLAALTHGKPFFAPSLAGPFSFAGQSLVLFAVAVIVLFALAQTFRSLPRILGVYALLTVSLCIFSTEMSQPLEGLDRYALVIFPLWMAAGAWLAERRLARPVVLIGAALLAFYAYQFATWAFVA